MCEQVERYPRWRSSPLGSVVVDVGLAAGGEVRMANSWSECITCVALEINVL